MPRKKTGATVAPVSSFPMNASDLLPREPACAAPCPSTPASAAGFVDPGMTADELRAMAEKFRQAELELKPPERDTKGRFAKGNSGGTGNPHARHCAMMLETLRNAFTREEVLSVSRKLFELAVGGNVPAIKIFFSYVIGKPLDAPHPDQIDRDEWDHYQKDAMRPEEMAAVLGAMPSSVGNEIARAALPIVSAAKMQELGQMLMPTGKERKALQAKAANDLELAKKPPGANGENGAVTQMQSAGSNEDDGEPAQIQPSGSHEDDAAPASAQPSGSNGDNGEATAGGRTGSNGGDGEAASVRQSGSNDDDGEAASVQPPGSIGADGRATPRKSAGSSAAPGSSKKKSNRPIGSMDALQEPVAKRVQRKASPGRAKKTRGRSSVRMAST